MKRMLSRPCGIVLSTMSSRIFLCYAREDSIFCETLVAALRDGRVDVLWDRALSPPLDYAEQVRSMIRSADSFAVVMTPASASSPECRSEMQYAIECGKRLIPILRGAAVDAALLPEPIRRLQWCFSTAEHPLAPASIDLCRPFTNAEPCSDAHALLNHRGREESRYLGTFD